jgi:hypothetical protein
VRIAVHLLGKSAHDDLLGSGATARFSMLRQLVGAFEKARTYDLGAVSFRKGDACDSPANQEVVAQGKSRRPAPPLTIRPSRCPMGEVGA